MRRIFTFFALLVPFACYANNTNSPPPSEHRIEYHHGKLFFTPPDSDESTYFGWIVSKTDYSPDGLTWSCTTCVQAQEKEPEIHTLKYQLNPKNYVADITSEDSSVSGFAQLVGTPNKWEEVNAQITFDTGPAKLIINVHETIHEGSVTIQENLFMNKESKDSFIGTFKGNLNAIDKDYFESIFPGKDVPSKKS